MLLGSWLLSTWSGLSNRCVLWSAPSWKPVVHTSWIPQQTSRTGSLEMSVCVCVLSGSVMSDTWDPIDCSLPGSSVHGILQARILEWVAISFSRGSSWLRNRTQVSYIAGRLITDWATREALGSEDSLQIQHSINPKSLGVLKVPVFKKYIKNYSVLSRTYLPDGGRQSEAKLFPEEVWGPVWGMKITRVASTSWRASSPGSWTPWPVCTKPPATP